MNKYRIIIQNAYTGELVHEDQYCNGYLLLTGRGRQNKYGGYKSGKLLAKDISEAGIADMIVEDKLMERVRKRLNRFHIWLWTPAGLWARMRIALEERRERLQKTAQGADA